MLLCGNLMSVRGNFSPVAAGFVQVVACVYVVNAGMYRGAAERAR